MKRAVSISSGFQENVAAGRCGNEINGTPLEV
jgi:hypothetical protein